MLIRKNQNISKALVRKLFLGLALGIVAKACFAQNISVFYSLTVPQQEFAANDIKTALEAKGFTVEFKDLSTLTDSYEGKKVVIALTSNSDITTLLETQGGNALNELEEQAYALRTTTAPEMSYWVFGGDVNGAMYGALQIAENITFNGYAGTYNNQETPFMLNRGMKLNLPLDRRIPTYVGGWSSNSAKEAIPAVWDSIFWKTLIDQQARNRYNMLSVWVHHPFPALVKLDDYPNASLPNIEGFDGYVNNMNHEQRVTFWRRIMQYAHSRGMSFYFFNWNVYVDYAKDQYPAITRDKNNATTKDYMYKSLQALIDTYPELDGFGISAGDGMGTDESFSSNEEKTNWTWDCFGKAVKDYLNIHPDRKFNLIHRSIGTNFNLVNTTYQPLESLPNAAVNFSIKYAMAHMYSTPTPEWTSGEISNVANAGKKTWITVRNDDYFYINWGDHQFVRDFMNGIPNKAAITGMYIGSDGYNPSRTYFHKNDALNGQLEVERRWYMEMLWGRLSYNPQTSNDVFKNMLATRFPSANSDNLFEAWTLASRPLPKVTELVMKDWKLDFHWWPEACWSDPGRCTGFRTIDGFDSFATTDVAKGSDLCNIANSAAGNCSGKKSTYTLADEMEADGLRALELADEMIGGGNVDLELAITNIKQMAWLSCYYAYKIRGATYKEAGQTLEAKDEMAKAFCSWMNYKNLMESEYYADDFRNVSISPDWNFGNAAVLKEYTDLGGVGDPSCNNRIYYLALSVDGGIGGTVSGDGIFNDGDSATVSAAPFPGYKFDGWKEDDMIVSTNTSYAFDVSTDRQLTADFSLDGSCILYFSHPGFTVVNNTVSWSSGALNISCAESVNISLDIEGIGADNSDICNVYYALDGGPRIDLSLNKASFSKKTVSLSSISGSTVELFLEVRNSFNDETYNVSNIVIRDAEKIALFYNSAIPQHEFAANDIKAALEARSFAVQLKDLSELTDSFNTKKVVISLASDTNVVSMMVKQGGDEFSNLEAQAYALRTTTTPQLSFWILGGDNNGAMYGGLQIAENINFNGFTGSYNEEESPYLKNRGIKFNIPLDKDSPTYFYNNGGSSHKEAIRHVWDMDFWTTWFDEMARHRYNVLSLWSPHPFTSMLNMEDEYPGIAIQGVTAYDENGNDLQVNNMTIDEKIIFWKQVMEYGTNRGFGIYFCTWNIFLSTAEDKHGLTDSPTDQETRTYLRKCMKQFLETYPDLAGFGITVGERMGGLNNVEKEEWAWDTYGKGMMEYAQANPERDLVFIHRQHQGNVSEMLDYFKQLSDLPNVRFDLSFKYSQAHAHAAVKPSYWVSKNMVDGLGPNNLKSWLTIRNDDFYFLHWADPQFVRDYVNNFPEVGKYVDAFYIGADGWVFTKVFTSKNPYYEDKDALSIQKTWYMQKLWGRISYNPSVSDALFKDHLSLKYPEVSSEELFEAWSKASRGILLANEQVTGTWDLDFKWWPEGWTSKDGFLGLPETTGVDPMNGSNLCSFANTADNNCGSKISALITADQIEQLANEALAIIGGISAGSNTELMLNLKDLEAMANLSIYNANKFRAAVYLEQGNQNEAREAIGTAYCYWMKYTNIMDLQYIGVDLQRNHDFSSWHENDAKALQDYRDLGGAGDPNCNDQYPWVYIKSPGNNEVFLMPADVKVDIDADAGSNSIDSVELISNDTLVGRDYEYPYSFELTDLSAGTFTLEAIVYDDQEATDNYSINIKVYDPESFNTVPWIEDFELFNGTTLDDGPTSWTCSRSGGNFQVGNNVLFVNDDGPEGVFTTSTIDISGGQVDVSLDLWSEGKLESDDYVKLFKIIDNREEELIGIKTANQNTITKIEGNALGNNLVLKIRAKVSHNSEYYYLDNLSVTYNTSKLDQTITFPDMPTKNVSDDDFDPGATASSGLAVSYSSSNTDVASIENEKIHIIAAGTSTISASQAGDNNYNPSEEVSQTLTVSRQDQTITFPDIATKNVSDDDFDPGATASSGLAVSYSSSNTDVASIENEKIHIIAVGTSTISASQAGDMNYNPAQDVSQAFNVTDQTSSAIYDYNVSLYPNPATTEVFISVPEEYSIAMLNLNGNELIKQTHLIGLNKFYVKDFTAGIYFLKISGNNFHEVKKVIIEK